MKLPKGFKCAGVSAGLKDGNRKDMGLIVSDVVATCAGCTTTNKTAAACVVYNRKVLPRGKAKTIVVNTKFANACTGKEGYADNLAMAQKAGSLYGGPVLTASTGVIGKRMPLDKILKGVETLGNSLVDSGKDFADAILTTDLTVKKISKTIILEGKEVIIAGASKGSGMIHPNMATMLGFIMTDAKVTKALLQKLVKELTAVSFNQITVDGDTSTNDMVLCLANGMSGVTINSENVQIFRNALEEIFVYLAKEIARDGEGATKLIEVRVRGAKTEKDARLVARTVAGSQLVKCAVYGEDDNWGRVIAAVGRSGAVIDADKVAMRWTGLKTREVAIEIDLKIGKKEGVAWGCDMTEGYIKINTNYN
jgi:glutamate N-acetyltransferase/amino-acid N-acetyltransferase